MDDEGYMEVWRHRQERLSQVHQAAADAMNKTGTNPNPQAQFLATTAAKNGFDLGVRAALETFNLCAEHIEDFEGFMNWYREELMNYVTEDNDG